MASTSIVCHIRENVTGERVCPITTGARCTPTHDMSVSGSLELRRLQDQVHLMRLPQQPQRESGQFSWDSRSDLCGDAVDFHGTPAPAAAGIRSFCYDLSLARSCAGRAPQIAPERTQSVRLPRNRRCSKRGSAAQPVVATRAVQVGALLASKTASHPFLRGGHGFVD